PDRSWRAVKLPRGLTNENVAAFSNQANQAAVPTVSICSCSPWRYTRVSPSTVEVISDSSQLSNSLAQRSGYRTRSRLPIRSATPLTGIANELNGAIGHAHGYPLV